MKHRISLSILHLMTFLAWLLLSVFFAILAMSPSLRYDVLSYFSHPSVFYFVAIIVFGFSLLMLLPFWIYHKGSFLILSHKPSKVQIDRSILEKYLKEFFCSQFGVSIKEVEILTSGKKVQTTIFVHQLLDKEKMDLVKEEVAHFLERNFSYRGDIALIFIQK